MKAGLLFISLFFISVGMKAQSVPDDEPMYVLDSVVVPQSAMEKLTPDMIGLITVAKGSKAVEKYGKQAENGVMYIETKPFAHKRVNEFLKQASPAYDSLYRKYGSDSSFYIVINGKPVTPTNEALFVTLGPRSFRSLEVISGKEAQKKYEVKDRVAGVIIISSEE